MTPVPAQFWESLRWAAWSPQSKDCPWEEPCPAQEWPDPNTSAFLTTGCEQLGLSVALAWKPWWIRRGSSWKLPVNDAPQQALLRSIPIARQPDEFKMMLVELKGKPRVVRQTRGEGQQEATAALRGQQQQ